MTKTSNIDTANVQKKFVKSPESFLKNLLLEKICSVSAFFQNLKLSFVI